jgi:hypothetical protein
MPWGIDRDEVEATLRHWGLRAAGVAFLPHRNPRGLPRLLADMASHVPVAQDAVPSLVHVTISTAPRYSRKPEMTFMSHDTSNAGTMGDVMSAAAQNARQREDIARATRQVVSKRVAIGIAAAFDPLRADHIELSRMVPEKVEAFSTAGLVMLTQSGQANRRMIRFASDEVMTTARAARELTDCWGPAAFAEAQNRLTREWFHRATSNFFTMGMLALTAQAAAMAPIHQTVVGNAERLAE